MTLFIGETRPFDAYPRLPYRGEDGRAVLRREPCACGLEAVRLSGEDDPSAVRRHNATAEHIAWRMTKEATELDGLPTADPGARDLSAIRPARPVLVQRWRRA